MSDMTVAGRIVAARDLVELALYETQTREPVPDTELVTEFFHRWQAMNALSALHLVQQQGIPCGSWPFGEHTVVRFASGSAMVEPTVSRLVRPVSSYTYNHEARFR